MSKVFYDHLIEFTKLEIHVNSITQTQEEKNELWEIIDKLIHNRVVKRILQILPSRHHDEFADLLHKRPFDKDIIRFVEHNADEDIEKYLQDEINKLEQELLHELQQDG